jgi:hypothetical protein
MVLGCSWKDPSAYDNFGKLLRKALQDRRSNDTRYMRVNRDGSPWTVRLAELSWAGAWPVVP